MNGCWRWEAYDPDGRRLIADVLPDVWWPLDAGEAAALAMALLMLRVRPHYARLSGWQVRAWRGDAEARVVADEWLKPAAA